MATHSSILAWKIPWTEEPGWLQSTRSQRVRRNYSNLARTHVRLDLSLAYDWGTCHPDVAPPQKLPHLGCASRGSSLGQKPPPFISKSLILRAATQACPAWVEQVHS